MQEACRCSWIENVPIVDFAKKLDFIWQTMIEGKA